MIFYRRDILAVLASAVLLQIAPLTCALAQQPTQAQSNAIRQNCATDYRAHCASVPTGGSAALACLQQNAGSVSAPCQSALAAVSGGGQAPAAQTTAPAAPTQSAMPAPQRPMTPMQEMMLVRRACAPDYQTLCRGVPLGGGRAVACLDENESFLSEGCRGALVSARQMR